ncbi:YceI family protein [Flavobacteriaceae bacterium F08102]|nr:YceI family protein [Flavobacteriaceae bacterium F08102]
MNVKNISSLAILVLLLTVSCKKEPAKKEVAQFSIEPETITVNWTGYKTTDKVAVKGEFKEITVSNMKSDTTAYGALNGAKFDIPVSSLFSNDEIRDGKLKELFFGVMNATNSLTGTLDINADGTGDIDLLMNGVQRKVPITYVTNDQLVEIEGILHLEDFEAQNALESLAKACFDLHKGADGVSKTWSEVKVEAKVYLKKK